MMFKGNGCVPELWSIPVVMAGFALPFVRENVAWQKEKIPCGEPGWKPPRLPTGAAPLGPHKKALISTDTVSMPVVRLMISIFAEFPYADC